MSADKCINGKTMMGFYKLLILIHTLSFCPFFCLMDSNGFFRFPCRDQFFSGRYTSGQNNYAHEFFFFFLTLKLLFFWRSKIWMQRACTQVHTHSLKSVLLLISPLHICLLAVCFFPINKALIAFSLECDLACCMLSLDWPWRTYFDFSLSFFWNPLPHTIIQLHPVASNKNKQAME